MTLGPTAQRLYDLLPAVHRIRDQQHGGVLAELISVLADQVDVLDEELSQFYDDQFIETCARWVGPYLGDLVGYRLIHGVVPEVASPRAEVANTIAYRRRKGTAAVIEQLARDVTGWPARAVEFFERTTATQYMNHPRRHARATIDLRDHEALAQLAAQGGAFDDLAHTADVRRIAARRPSASGRHNIPNVGIFLWRTHAVPVARSPLVEHADRQRFRFDRSGADTQLFGLPRTEPSITHLAEPFDVPLPLGRRWLSDHLDAYYGPRRTLLLERQVGAGPPTPIAAQDVRICDLSDTSATSWAHEPPAGTAAIDPALGRVFLGTPLVPGERVLATWAYGQAVPIGSGAVKRRLPATPEPRREVAGGADVQPHLDAVRSGGTVLLSDSDRYEQGLTITTLPSPGSAGAEVHVVAADRAMPTVVLAGDLRLTLAPDSTVVLDGLCLSGGPVVVDEVGDTQRRTLVLRNCDLVPGHGRTTAGQATQPGRASLIVLDPFAQVVVERSVLGPIVAVEGAQVRLTDSAVDAGQRGRVAICGRPPVTGGLRTVASLADMEVGDGTVAAGDVDLNATTVVGGILCTRLDASNSILLATLAVGDPRPAAVHARRRQVGCLRYSFVPEDSRVPQRYRCRPDPDDPPSERRATRPRFTSLRYGDPGFLQLAATTPDSIRRGADDESEMGVTHFLYTPQRESNLAQRLDEYLRFGLQAGSFYAT